MGCKGSNCFLCLFLDISGAHATDPTVIEEDVDVESLDALKESLILYMNEEVNQRTAETSDRQAGHVLWAGMAGANAEKLEES